MKYSIEIDDKGKAKSGIIEVLKQMAKTYKGIHVRKITKQEMEERADKVLLREMLEARKEGLADPVDVEKRLGIK